MSCRIAPIAAVALLAFGLSAEPALGAPGDTVVPAHRTRSGAYVPANVPPLSAGTRLAPRLTKSGKPPIAREQATTTLLVPLFAEARSIRR